MTRTYQYVFDDAAHSHITITTGNPVQSEFFDFSHFYAGYDIISITGTFEGQQITGLLDGNSGSYRYRPEIGYYAGSLLVNDSQGINGSAYGIDALAFTTAAGTYVLHGDAGNQLSYQFGAQQTVIGLQSYVPAPPDTTPPKLVYFQPADHQTQVNPASDLLLSFNEYVQGGKGTITISDGQGDTRVIDINDQTQVQFVNQHHDIEINPTQDLKPHTVYSVTVSAGAITDSSGNAYAGLPAGVLDFKTQSVLTGSDYVINGTSDIDIITGTATDHIQTLNGYAGDDIIRLGHGGGFADGGLGHDQLYGGDSDNGFTANYLTDNGDNDNMLYGGNATGHGTVQNFLTGPQAGHNELWGGNADGLGASAFNVINGGTGLNLLFGGVAADGATVQNIITDRSPSPTGVYTTTGGGAVDPNSSAFNQITIIGDGRTANGGNAINQAHTLNIMMADGQNDGLTGGSAGAGADNHGLVGGGGTVVNQLIANGLNETLNGGVATDASHVQNFMTGGGGADHFQIYGSNSDSTETDMLTGGSGSDLFSIRIDNARVADVTITDFKTGTDGSQDRLSFETIYGNTLTKAQVLASATEHDGSTVIDPSQYGAHESITLAHVTLDMLSASDFLWA